ncbi:hypothetical protein [uncultured Bacteroides sp.]|uniref:hypothetical protein n=1 Tax=uncultured Bacteroides sp. TaxID=162156 RepID=UPI002AA6C8C1|nr:hypothetical protein [uncultured Bacteroides sp.]
MFSATSDTTRFAQTVSLALRSKHSLRLTLRIRGHSLAFGACGALLRSLWQDGMLCLLASIASASRFCFASLAVAKWNALHACFHCFAVFALLRLLL